MLEKRTFYGQLQHIIVADIHAVPSVNELQTTLILAIIRSCAVDEDHPQLDIHYYGKEGPIEVVDVTTIQCLIGRIWDRGKWSTVDRSGTLARAVYVEETSNLM